MQLLRVGKLASWLGGSGWAKAAKSNCYTLTNSHIWLWPDILYFPYLLFYEHACPVWRSSLQQPCVHQPLLLCTLSYSVCQSSLHIWKSASRTLLKGVSTGFLCDGSILHIGSKIPFNCRIHKKQGSKKVPLLLMTVNLVPFSTIDLKSHPIAESIRSRAQKSPAPQCRKVDFFAGKVTFKAYLPNKQGFRQLILWQNH